MKKQTTPLDRIKLEITEEQDRITKLKSFIVKRSKDLNAAENYLLSRQVKLMEEKLKVLKARLSIWREL